MVSATKAIALYIVFFAPNIHTIRLLPGKAGHADGFLARCCVAWLRYVLTVLNIRLRAFTRCASCIASKCVRLESYIHIICDLVLHPDVNLWFLKSTT